MDAHEREEVWRETRQRLDRTILALQELQNKTEDFAEAQFINAVLAPIHKAHAFTDKWIHDEYNAA